MRSKFCMWKKRFAIELLYSECKADPVIFLGPTEITALTPRYPESISKSSSMQPYPIVFFFELTEVHELNSLEIITIIAKVWFLCFSFQAQFFILSLRQLHSLVTGSPCGYPAWPAYVLYPQFFFITFMFADFYRRAYLWAKNSHSCK